MERAFFAIGGAARIAKAPRDHVLDSRHDDPDFAARVEVPFAEVGAERASEHRDIARDRRSRRHDSGPREQRHDLRLRSSLDEPPSEYELPTMFDIRLLLRPITTLQYTGSVAHAVRITVQPVHGEPRSTL